MSYQLHPLCTLFPRMVGAEFEALKQDILNNGLHQPIVLHEGMVLDGGNRYKACLELGVEPLTEEYEGDDIVSYVLSANLHRRHMSPGQQAAIVASAQDWDKAHKAGRSKCSNEHFADNVNQSAQMSTLNVPEEQTSLSTTKQRAILSGASVATQRRADAVAKADPELSRKVAQGEVKLGAAIKQVAPQLAPDSKTRQPADPAEPSAAERIANYQEIVKQLQAENIALRDKATIESLDISEETKLEYTQLIPKLREEIRQLQQLLESVTASRDTYQRENAQLKHQIKLMKKEAGK